MQNSKLIRILQVLDPGELKHLGKFLASAFFNANPAIVKLFRLLRSHHPDFNSPKLEKKRLFRSLFPGRAYDHQKLLNLMSDFVSLIEKYLALMQLEKEELEQQKLLLRAYAQLPDCYTTFEKKVRNLEGYLDEQPYRGEQYFQEKMALELLYFNHPETVMVKTGAASLLRALQYFEAYKSLAEVKLQCARNEWGHAVGIEKTINNIVENPALTDPVYILYEHLNRLQHGSTDRADLHRLIKYFLGHIDSFCQDDKSNALKILLNYCNRQINKGDTDFIKTSLELYKSGLAHDCFFVQGKLKEATFSNIVSIGIVCREFEWTEHFVETYQKFLTPKVRADALILAKAQWHFAKQDYLKVTELLQHTFAEPQTIVKARVMVIQSWCELFWQDGEYLEILLSQLDAFEKYMQRNRKVSARLVEGIQHTIGFVRKLALLRLEGKPTADIRSAILQEPNVTLKAWLLEKAGSG
ncbi:MAG: hypothetical protein H6565_15445 [Lewinellaceae bacterium]|nr:hypothetical protein [Lewinellaceae bacterium]